MAYAKTYETGLRFGYENMEASRKIFFAELKDLLVKLNVNPGSDISTVFEVGCSLGYQLRYLETDLFTGAQELQGIDIDRYAIAAGAAYLEDVRSKVRLVCADMEEIEPALGDRSYDIIVCTGTLMYLNEASAAHVVSVMLRHTGTILAIAWPIRKLTIACFSAQQPARRTSRSYITLTPW
jgi:SAM-dependent methyltransferase